MSGFGDDDFFGGSAFPSTSSSSRRGHFADFQPEEPQDPYGYGEVEETHYHQPPVRQSRQRRASIGTPVAPSASRVAVPRTNSSDDVYLSGGAARNGGGRRREPTSGGASSRSQDGRHLEGHFDHGGSSNRKLTSERSIATHGSGSGTRRPGGRRASLAAGATSLSSRNARPMARAEESSMYGGGNEEPNYGYDYGNHDNQYHSSADFSDMGYGDNTEDVFASQPAPEAATRARRQRRCSIADVVSTAAAPASDYGYGDAPPDSSVEAARPRLGAHTGGISNMAIPMTAAEEPKKTNRRGSIAMLGNIGRGKAAAAKEPETTKKPVADRDRQRQGLLDRVGAAESRGASRNGTTSYSDRIMSK